MKNFLIQFPGKPKELITGRDFREALKNAYYEWEDINDIETIETVDLKKHGITIQIVHNELDFKVNCIYMNEIFFQYNWPTEELAYRSGAKEAFDFLTANIKL
jgi:hypothetical protein